MTSTVNWSNPIWRRLTPLLRWPWELIPLLALYAWLYWQTMPPGISSWIVEGWDSAMLQITGSTWGIPHSPGYPFYTILTNLFVRLLNWVPGLSHTSVVWRVTFWSTVTSLGTLVFLFFIVRRLTRNRILAFGVTALLGGGFIFWRGAIMAEVYSLNTLIFAATYWLAMVWHTNRRHRWLILLGLVLGVGVAHHRTALILPPTIALWVAFKRESSEPGLDQSVWPRWKILLQRWSILVACSFIPLLSYLYLPWVAANQVGQTWIYADTSDWNTFWFVLLSREWWGLVQIPDTLRVWFEDSTELFYQQAEQMGILGVIGGVFGLILAKRYVWLFGLPFLFLTFFGVAYKVADLDSMLMPLTLTLCIGLSNLAGVSIRRLVSWLIKWLRGRDKELRGDKWLSTVLKSAFSLALLMGTGFLFFARAQANYEAVDLSGDWQAEDLVEEVVAMAGAGTPLTIIGQDNSVLPDFIYAKVVLGHPVEPLSTTTLARMPEEASIDLLRRRFEAGQRVLVDIETLDLGFIPWISNAIEQGQIFLAPTGHPFLWELLPRPMSNILPKNETWTHTPPGQFLDGQVSVIAYHQRIIHKRTGCFLRLTLFWRLESLVEDDYFVAVQPLGGEMVLDKNDHLALMRGFLPTSQIKLGEIVRDEIDMLIRQPAALPSVNLVVNLYQVVGDQFPVFGNMSIPIMVDPEGCSER